jgi:hypothetical protein
MVGESLNTVHVIQILDPRDAQILYAVSEKYIFG